MTALIVGVAHVDSAIRVRFESGYGSGVAIWNESTAPVVGALYDVEFRINEKVAIKLNARIRDDSQAAIAGDDSSMTLIGIVEDQDDDNVAYFRIGVDCLMMFESNDDNLKGRCLELTIHVQSVELTPFGR